MRSLAVGRIEVSRNARFAVGEYLYGWFGWQDYCLATEPMVLARVQLKNGPLSAGLGIYGISGLTAVLALGEIGRPQAGETVLVSTAAGAVGSVVGQIARRGGCRVVGLTGSDDKASAMRRGVWLSCGAQLSSGPGSRATAEPVSAGRGRILRQYLRRDRRCRVAAHEHARARGAVWHRGHRWLGSAAAGTAARARGPDQTPAPRGIHNLRSRGALSVGDRAAGRLVEGWRAWYFTKRSKPAWTGRRRHSRRSIAAKIAARRSSRFWTAHGAL